MSANPNTEREETMGHIERRIRDSAENGDVILAHEARWLLADRDLLARALRLASEEIAEARNWQGFPEPFPDEAAVESVLAGLLREAAKTT